MGRWGWSCEGQGQRGTAAGGPGEAGVGAEHGTLKLGDLYSRLKRYNQSTDGPTY